MNLLYSIIFSPPSTFCALNLFENRSSPNTLLIEENTISAIHLLPASFICFHLWYPSSLINSISSLLKGHLLSLVDALFLIAITGSTSNLSSKLKFLLLSCALSAHTLSILYLLINYLIEWNSIQNGSFPQVLIVISSIHKVHSMTICGSF